MKEYHHEYKTGTGKVLRAGDTIRVDGERDQFRMVSHVVNIETGAEWIECVTADRMRVFRAFRPERCHRVLGKRRETV